MTDEQQEDFKGVEDSPEHLKIDADALEEYLSTRISGFSGPLDVKLFKGGQSNPTYLLTTPSARYVLRRKPPGKLLPSAHAVDREYRIMTALRPQGFPVPQTFILCEDESVIGSMFFVMAFLDGRIFWDPRLPELERADRRPVVEAATETLAHLHKIDVAAAGLDDYGRPGNYFERQIGRWTKQYRAAETDPIEEMNRLVEFLPTATPAGEETSIVHGDYRLDNMVIAPDAPKVIGVLDWELSTLGHPLADFTNYLMAWYFPETLRGGLANANTAEIGIPSAEETVDHYCALTGRDGMPDLDYCLAFNMFRLAAIIQGIRKRAIDGNASSSQAEQVGKQVYPLAELAWSFAKKAGA